MGRRQANSVAVAVQLPMDSRVLGGYGQVILDGYHDWRGEWLYHGRDPEKRRSVQCRECGAPPGEYCMVYPRDVKEEGYPAPWHNPEFNGGWEPDGDLLRESDGGCVVCDFGGPRLGAPFARCGYAAAQRQRLAEV